MKKDKKTQNNRNEKNPIWKMILIKKNKKTLKLQIGFHKWK